MLSTSSTATSGNQKYSPSLHFKGSGWGTTGAAAQSVDWAIYNVPVQGTAPTSTLNFDFSVNGGGYSNKMTLNSAGNLTTTYMSASRFYPNGSKTTINGSTSGSADFGEDFGGTGFKIVTIKLNALNGTASWTYSVAFTSTPLLMTSDGLTSSSIVSKSTTAVTVTGTTTSGMLILIGY